MGSCVQKTQHTVFPYQPAKCFTIVITIVAGSKIIDCRIIRVSKRSEPNVDWGGAGKGVGGMKQSQATARRLF